MNSITFNTEFSFVEEQFDEAFASVSLNPSFRWVKFILTDDKPNLNKTRIPVEEFDNLIRTGIHAPIKMASKKIREGHEDSIPLGTITALRKDGDKVEGLAALWSLEREEDVQLIKQSYDEGKPLNLSWEVFYKDAEEEEGGVTALRGTILRATTLVGMPAYAGRTPILQVASVDKNPEDNTLELEELQKQLDELKAEFETKKTELETLVSSKDAEIEQLKKDNQELAQFKSEVETKKAEDEKVASIKTKFVESGIEKPEDYFETNREFLLTLDEKALDFMLQELVAFASKVKSEQASAKDGKVTVPNLPDTSTTKLSPKELAKKLRE